MWLYKKTYDVTVPTIDAVLAIPAWRHALIMFAVKEYGNEVLCYAAVRAFMKAPSKSKALAIHDIFFRLPDKTKKGDQGGDLLINAMDRFAVKEPEDYASYLELIRAVGVLKSVGDSIDGALQRWLTSGQRKVAGDIFEPPAYVAKSDIGDSWGRFTVWSSVEVSDKKIMGKVVATTLSLKNMLMGPPKLDYTDSSMKTAMNSAAPSLKRLATAGISLTYCPVKPALW